MATIGDNRMRMYRMLYDYPLYDYITDDNNINILIIGNGWVGNEAFKAVFWCGQYPDTKLNITIASQNAENYKESLKEHLPGLKNFADFNNVLSSKYHYANINIRNVSFENIKGAGITKDICSKECLNLLTQNYIIVSVGDDDTNYLIADSISEQLANSTQNHVINVFLDEYIEIPSINNNIKINTIANKVSRTHDIIKLAKNINFIYHMKNAGNSHVDINEINRFFDKEYENEFVFSPKETNEPSASICNFSDGNYNVDSSIANAVHTKYKLQYCTQNSNIKNENALIEIINSQNELYNRLIAWEHRRWNAFMTIRGFRYPEQDELDYIYRGKNTHKDMINKLHICLCECGNNGTYLTNHYDIWDKNTSSNLSELDQASLLCYKTLKRRTENCNEQFKTDIEYLRKHNFNSKELSVATKNLANAIEMLVSDEPNAYKLYEYAYTNAQNHSKNITVTNKLSSIDNKLNLLKLRNKKVDFFALDAELINMLPICLFMCKQNTTVISLVEEQSANNIIVPWILFPKKVIFLVKDTPNLSDRKKSISDFFRAHGNYTEIEFKKLSTSSVPHILNSLEKNINGDTIINIQHNASPTITMAVSQFYNKVPILIYNNTSGLICYNDVEKFPQKTLKKGLLVNEYFNLMSGNIENPFAAQIAYDECRPLEAIFWRNNLLQADIKKSGDKTSIKLYNNWNKVIISEFLHKKNKDSNGSRIALPLSDNLEHKKIELEFINVLAQSKIISLNSSLNSKEIKFTITDKTIYNALTTKGGTLFELIVYYKMLYSGYFSDVKTNVKFLWGFSGEDNIINEIDVVCMYDYIPVLISCKTTPSIENEYIYEISSEAAKFNAIPVLAVSQDLSSSNNYNHSSVVRASGTGVALIDSHILSNDNLLKKAISQILTGQYKGPENFS